MRSPGLYNKLEELWANPSRNERLKKAVVILVILVSLGIGLRPSTQTAKIILVLIAGVCGLIALLRWPNLGLLLALLGAFFVSFSGPGGINIAILAIAGLSALWILDMIVRQRKISFTDRRTTIAIIAFILSALISFGIGQLPWYPLARHAPFTAQFGGLMIFIFSAMAFLLVANTVRKLGWLQAITWSFVAIGALYIVARLTPAIANVMRHYFQSGATTGALFWVWLAVIPFSQALFNTRLKVIGRAALLFLVALTLYVAVFRSGEWKSGYLPALAGMAAIVAFKLRRKIVWLIPLALIVVYMLGSEAITSDEYSYVTRLDAWKIVIQLALISPIFGLGFGNYYWFTPLESILGWRVAFNSHSQYVDLFAQTGLVGVAIFFWLMGEIGMLAWNLRDRAPEGFARAYVYGAFGGLIGTLVSGVLVDWVLPFVYNIGMNGFRASFLSWMFMGGLVTIRLITEQNENSSGSSQATGG